MLLGQGAELRSCGPWRALAPGACTNRPRRGLDMGGSLFGRGLDAPEEHQSGPALSFHETHGGGWDWAVGVTLLWMGLAIEAVLHEEVDHFTHALRPDISDSNLKQNLDELAAADVCGLSLCSPCKSDGYVISQFLHRSLRFTGNLGSSCNHTALLPGQAK